MGFKRIDTTSNRLRIALKNAGKKQVDLAKETGIDSGSISHYLKGKYEPKSDAIFLMAKALNVSEMWLWGYDCDMERKEAIEENPQEMAERHFEIIMDEDLAEIFEDFKKLDEKKKKIVKDLIKSLADAEV